MEKFEKQDPLNNEQKKPEETLEEQETMKIKGTKEFQLAIEEGGLDEAITWLEEMKDEPKYDERWLDHRSRELMGALCDAGRLDEAEKYIDYAQSEKGKEGRRKKIEALKG